MKGGLPSSGPSLLIQRFKQNGNRTHRPQGRYDSRFHEDGVSIPVTLIEVEPNRVTQVRLKKSMATALYR